MRDCRYGIVLGQHDQLIMSQSSDIYADVVWMVETTQAFDALTDLLQGPCTTNQLQVAKAGLSVRVCRVYAGLYLFGLTLVSLSVCSVCLVGCV